MLEKKAVPQRNFRYFRLPTNGECAAQAGAKIHARKTREHSAVVIEKAKIPVLDIKPLHFRNHRTRRLSGLLREFICRRSTWGRRRSWCGWRTSWCDDDGRRTCRFDDGFPLRWRLGDIWRRVFRDRPGF